MVTTFASGLTAPQGLAFDSNGTLYVANNGNNTISKITSDGTVTNYASVNSPSYITCNSLSQYLYASSSNANIYKSIDMACFNYDTKILCLNSDLKEEYVPIQNLKDGDWVKTYLHGYRQIYSIKNDTIYNQEDDDFKCMYKMVKDDTNGLTEDLIITGGHAILVDELTDENHNTQKSRFWGFDEKIDDKKCLLACISDKFVKEQNNDLYTYYHFAVDNDNDDQRFGVYANGILVEIPSKNFFKSDIMKVFK